MRRVLIALALSALAASYALKLYREHPILHALIEPPPSGRTFGGLR